MQRFQIISDKNLSKLQTESVNLDFNDLDFNPKNSEKSAFINSDFHENMNDLEIVDLGINYMIANSEELDAKSIYNSFLAREMLSENIGIKKDNFNILFIGESALSEELSKIKQIPNLKINILKTPSIKNIKKAGNTTYLGEEKIDASILFINEDFLDFDKSFFKISDFANHKELSEAIEEFLTKEKTYLPTIDTKYCDYHHYKDGNLGCNECLKACKDNAIEIKNNLLSINTNNCIACGSCVSACLSGTIIRKNLSLEVIINSLNIIKNNNILLISKAAFEAFKELQIPLKRTSILILETLNFDYASYLAILQTIGKPFIMIDFYNDFARENIDFINEISIKILHKKGILTPKIEEVEIISMLEEIESSGTNFSYFYDDEANSRQNFVQRLQFLIKDNDFGKINSKNFANLKVDENKCTLCMSCATVCKHAAFFGDESQKSLRLNTSLCTNCDLCLKVCPEQCITKEEGLFLNSKFLEARNVATDEVFHCIECGVGFANHKTIKKVIEFMIPKFMGDELKIKSISCCPTCKAKLMLQNMIKG